MIGTKFSKPLEADTLTREVMRTVTREVQEQEPVYDENGRPIVHEIVAKTVTEDVPFQERYDNPAPNTYTKYCEAVQWCKANRAIIVECAPDKEYPQGYYEVQAIPEPSIEEVRDNKLAKLNSIFEEVRQTAWVMSSLGFKADANETANTNVEGLIKSMTAKNEATTLFCDYDNAYHPVTLENLQTLQLEIIQNGQALYAQKWAMRNAINAATKAEEIEAINIVFTMMDFTI